MFLLFFRFHFLTFFISSSESAIKQTRCDRKDRQVTPWNGLGNNYLARAALGAVTSLTGAETTKLGTVLLGPRTVIVAGVFRVIAAVT